MAVWKGVAFVSAAGLISFLINKWNTAKKYRILKLLPLLPAAMALIQKLGPGPVLDRFFVIAGHCTYHSLFALSLSKWIPMEYGVLWIYAPLPLVFERQSFGLNALASHNDIFYSFYIQTFWSFPIISSMKLLSRMHQSVFPKFDYIARSIHSPMISIISDDICVGRLPLNEYEVDILRESPYNIGAVVNLCIEATGPIAAYQRNGIRYIRLPTVDTLPPMLDDIISAMNFIEKFKEDKDNAIVHQNRGIGNQKRVLIHCRGGRSRSATIALCWLIKTGMSVEESMKLLKMRRKAVHSRVQHYDVVHQYTAVVSGKVPERPRQHKRMLSFHLMD